jgi:hypothetical protein
MLGEMSRGRKAELTERQRHLVQTEDRIRAMLLFIADKDEKSEYAWASIKELEAQAKADKAAIAEFETQIGEPVPVAALDHQLHPQERALPRSPHLEPVQVASGAGLQAAASYRAAPRAVDGLGPPRPRHHRRHHLGTRHSSFPCRETG